MRTASQVMIFALIVISAKVFLGLMNRKDMWWWICTYWLVLTLKNLFDFIGGLNG